jgi:hypothetical protein
LTAALGAGRAALKPVGSGVARLATGFHPTEKVPEIFGPDVPKTALWRAVYVVAWLCSPVEFDGIKRHLRDLLGVSRIENRTYVGHLMTLVDLPWRHAKAHTRQQALRAWKNGGPIPHEAAPVQHRQRARQRPGAVPL